MLVTPEGVELALQLAGLGSRFIAGAIDLALQALTILILALLTGVLGGGGGLLAVLFVIAAFLVWFFYNVLFEVRAHGRTPGKRLSHLRVVRISGAPVDFTASAIRNLVRILDGPALLYLPTVIGIAATANNQRPGDVAAGTVVVREQPMPKTPRTPRRRSAHEAGSPVPPEAAAIEASAITVAELAAVRSFLERREGLDAGARRDLALRLATPLRNKASGVPADISPERFLEALVRIRTGDG